MEKNCFTFNKMAPEPSSPHTLLENLYIDGFNERNYAVSNDGTRFITRTQVGGYVSEANTGNGVINVVENWFEELKHLAPPSRN